MDPGLWRDCVEANLRDGLADTEGPHFESFVAGLRGLVGKILRYESRFRADGLLGPGDTVRTIAAWDLGRASKMARWGRGARYATRAEMHEALERVSAGVQQSYLSWGSSRPRMSWAAACTSTRSASATGTPPCWRRTRRWTSGPAARGTSFRSGCRTGRCDAGVAVTPVSL